VNKEFPHMNRRSLLALACGATLVFAACGSDSEGTDATAAPAGTSAATDGITIEGAWARNSPAMATAGAAYLNITSAVDDQLLGASADASIAGTVEIHETVMSDMGTDTTMGDMGTDTTMGGMTGDTMAPAMEMRPVDSIALPAGEMVSLAPGGYHVMLLDLAAPLEIGQTFTLTLTFEKAGTRDVEVTVAEAAP
jgi:copper(I)-binding protein